MVHQNIRHMGPCILHKITAPLNGTSWSSKLARRLREGSLGSGGATAGSAWGTMSGWLVLMSNKSSSAEGHAALASSSSLDVSAWCAVELDARLPRPAADDLA